MTTARPLRPRRWTAFQARALTVIARHGSDRPFTPIPGDGGAIVATPWNFRMRPSPSRSTAWVPSAPVQSDNSRCGAADRSIGLDLNGARLWLRLPARVCNDWLALRAPDLDVDELPAQFVDAAWEALVIQALDVLGATKFCPGMRVVIDEAFPGAASYPHAWTVSIHAPDTARTIDAELAADDAGLQCLAGLLSRIPAQDAADTCPAPAMPAIVMSAPAGDATLDAVDVQGLEVGDVVLFDTSLATLDGDAWLATPDGQGVRVRACEPGTSRYVVTQEWSLLMNDGAPWSADVSPGPDDSQPGPTDPGPPGNDIGPEPACPSDAGSAPAATPSVDRADHPGTDDGGLDVNRIQVRLAFELGEHSMTLGELRRLKPGEFFNLQRRIDAGPVHIRANGSLVGTAELVDIDGRIGARVLTLIPGSSG